MGAGNNVVNFANYLKRDFDAVVTINGQLVNENEELKAENKKLKELLKQFVDLNSQQLEEEKPKTRRRRNG